MKKINFLLFTFIITLISTGIIHAESLYFDFIKSEDNINIVNLIEIENGYMMISSIEKELYIYDKDGNKISTKEIDFNSNFLFQINGKNYIITHTSKNTNEKYDISIYNVTNSGEITFEEKFELAESFAMFYNEIYMPSIEPIIITGNTYTYIYIGQENILKLKNDITSAETISINNLSQEDSNYLSDLIEVRKNGNILNYTDGGYLYYDSINKTINYYKDKENVFSVKKPDTHAVLGATKFNDNFIIFTSANSLEELEDGTRIINHDIIIVDSKGTILETENILPQYDKFNFDYYIWHLAYSQYAVIGKDSGFFIFGLWKSNDKSTDCAYMLYFSNKKETEDIEKLPTEDPDLEEPKDEEKEETIQEDNGPETSDNVIIYSIVLIISILTFVLAVYKKPSL